jgi:bifunctional non-homologous end joining protein LigD
MEPAWVAPCIPTLVKTPPIGADWLHEIKHDGYRAISVIDRGRAQIFTRRGHDWSSRMPNIKGALEDLKVRSAVIDGEAVMTDKDGFSDFFALHLALARRSAPAATLMAFDLLELDGADLRLRPLEERRALLEKLLRKPRPWLQLSSAVEDEGAQVLRLACEMGLEGIISKRRGSPYRSGKNLTWRKTVCTKVEHFAVTGALPKRGPVRSLKLARLVEGQLTPCGWVGSGLSEADARKIRVALDTGQPIVAEVRYRGFIPAGELRHASLMGWTAAG